jgi:probable HAF family extracellular repeat protein
LPAAKAAGASFEVLGNFWPAGVSDDGNTVAGTGNDPAAPGQVLVLWTPTGGLRTAGFANSDHTTAHAISGDGSTILGVDYGARMLTWTAAGGIEYPPGTLGYPGGINRDGSVIVGGAGNVPFRWSRSTGAVALPVPSEWSADGHGNAVSADGSVVAGTLFNNPGYRRAFRWTAAGGTQLLDHPANIVGSDATAVSADGSTIVGWAFDADGINHSFRWTEDGGFHLLGHLPAFPGEPALSHTSRPSGATADGAVVVGSESFGSALTNSGAFIWDAAHGMRSLKAVLESEYGMNLTGWTLWSAGGITPDGRTIIGTGSHPQFGETVAWRVVLPEPGAATLFVLGGATLLVRRRR